MGIPFDDTSIRLCLSAFLHGLSLAELSNDAPQYDSYFWPEYQKQNFRKQKFWRNFLQRKVEGVLPSRFSKHPDHSRAHLVAGGQFPSLLRAAIMSKNGLKCCELNQSRTARRCGHSTGNEEERNERG